MKTDLTKTLLEASMFLHNIATAKTEPLNGYDKECILDASELICEAISEIDRLSDRNRKCIYPPCKVGDKVYKISRNKVKECEVVFIGISADEKCSYFNFIEKYADGTFYKSYSMVFDVIGKTVFLSREEAKRALVQRKEDKGNEIQ